MIAAARRTRHPRDVRYLVLLLCVACHGATTLHPIPGSDKDDGHGELAGASARLLTSDQGSGADPLSPRRRKRVDDEYGGSEYASYTVPTWTTPPPGAHRTYPRYAQTAGLTGAIEGTISWRGALPTKRATACGPEIRCC